MTEFKIKNGDKEGTFRIVDGHIWFIMPNNITEAFFLIKVDIASIVKKETGIDTELCILHDDGTESMIEEDTEVDWKNATIGLLLGKVTQS